MVGGVNAIFQPDGLFALSVNRQIIYAISFTLPIQGTSNYK